MSVLRLCLRRASTRSGRETMLDVVREQLEAIRAAGTWKNERVITSSQSHSISVQSSKEKVINMCANNYLGLADHPEVVAAAKAALDTHGSGLASVRFICGTQDIHKQLESRISEFHETDDSILYASCFDANAAIFEVLLTPEDAVFSDELNHASIIDGIRLCKAKKHRYKHRDMSDLEKLLRDSDSRLKLIVSDGVFSMDGTICPLKDMCDLADEYNAVVLIDECHATGFLGKSNVAGCAFMVVTYRLGFIVNIAATNLRSQTGRGTAEYFDVIDRVDLINSTMGKALGGAMGGYTTGPKEVIDLLRNRARPYLFSNTLPPAVVGATTKVFDMLLDSSGLVNKVQENTKLFRTKMTDAGFIVGGDPTHPICPIML
eukprot:gene8512-10251_t